MATDVPAQLMKGGRGGGGEEAYRTWPSFSYCRSNFKQCFVACTTYPFSRQATMASALAPRRSLGIFCSWVTSSFDENRTPFSGGVKYPVQTLRGCKSFIRSLFGCLAGVPVAGAM